MEFKPAERNAGKVSGKKRGRKGKQIVFACEFLYAWGSSRTGG